MNVKEIQEALIKAGFNPGEPDGIRGRQTIAAIKQFQAANGLKADGIVGPKTAEKLFPAGTPKEQPFAIPHSMPWLQEAFKLIGTREKPGVGSNEAINGWAKDLNLHDYTDDDIPWCGLFVAHCVGSQLPDEQLPGNPLGARNWQKFGSSVQPGLGSIMVFWRESLHGAKGHVGFYWAEDDEAFHILGGNQSDEVSIKRVAKNRLLQARWPKTVVELNHTVRKAEKNGKLSSNEA